MVDGLREPGLVGGVRAMNAGVCSIRPIVSQDFNWHDAGEGGAYVFGEDGYLTMDGSRGRVVCSRHLRNPIRSREGVVELKLRVVLGKRYHIRFYDSEERLAVDCQIDEDSRVRFARQGTCADSGRFLTFHYGKPYTDSGNRAPYVVPSDEHCLRFEGFDSAEGGVDFVLDGAEPVAMAGCLNGLSKELSKVELVTGEVGVGSVIRLREYVEYAGGVPVYREGFPLHWKPVSAPPDGMPDDNVCETLMRPTDYRWLETATRYGYVKAHIPCLPKGAVAFEMKTADAALESCLILEEYQGVIKYGNIQLGLLRGRMIVCTRDGVLKFDQPVEAASGRVYKIRVAWDRDAGTFRIRIDGTPMSCGGVREFPFPNVPERGIDTITLHPGDSRARLSTMQKCQGVKAREVEPLLTYWGRFRVYDLEGL